MKKIRKAVIPVAGFGTRFLPATIAQPKEMLPVVDKPVIQYIVEEMVASGIEEIIFVTGRGKRAIEDHFDYSWELEALLEERGKIKLLEEIKKIPALAKFVYVRQPKPLGNGHALLCAKEVVGNEAFAFTYGDDIITNPTPPTLQMIKAYEERQSLIVGVIEVPKEEVSAYGVVKPKDEGVTDKVFEISGVVEKPSPEEAPSCFANPGPYIFTPNIFKYLEETKPGRGGEIWIADAVEKVFKDQKVCACKLEGTRFDCGNKLEYLKANVDFALKRKDIGKKFREYLKSLDL